VVSAVATADSSYEVTGEGYAPRGEILKDGKPIAKNPVPETMARASVLCNESSIHEEGGAWKLRVIQPKAPCFPSPRKSVSPLKRNKPPFRGRT
jgi:hypothetical protein